MSHDPNPANLENKQPDTRTYIAGFGFSLILTLCAFLFVWLYKESDHQFFASNSQLFLWISLLAIVQLLVQLVFFLHLSRGSKSSWNLSVLSFAAIVVVILVFGSLWIMNNLNYRGGHTPDPQGLETEIIEDEGFHH